MRAVAAAAASLPHSPTGDPVACRAGIPPTRGAEARVSGACCTASRCADATPTRRAASGAWCLAVAAAALAMRPLAPSPPQARFFEDEVRPNLRHKKRGLLCMAGELGVHATTAGRPRRPVPLSPPPPSQMGPAAPLPLPPPSKGGRLLPQKPTPRAAAPQARARTRTRASST